MTGDANLEHVRSLIGEILARASQKSPQVIVAEIDVNQAADKALTARNDLLFDRRPGLYHLDSSTK